LDKDDPFDLAISFLLEIVGDKRCLLNIYHCIAFETVSLQKISIRDSGLLMGVFVGKNSEMQWIWI